MGIASGDKLKLATLQALSGVSLGDMVSRYDHSAENERIDLTAKELGKRFIERYGKKTK